MMSAFCDALQATSRQDSKNHLVVAATNSLALIRKILREKKNESKEENQEEVNQQSEISTRQIRDEDFSSSRRDKESEVRRGDHAHKAGDATCLAGMPSTPSRKLLLLH